MRVAIGLSGGVDSAVAAWLLKQEGYKVEGIFMKNWDEDDGTEYCTSVEDFEDAQRIADHIGIPLQAINFASEYWDDVFEDFLAEYSAGRTPNPDVLCNRHIKFSVFQDYVSANGAETVATGHYARLKHELGNVELHRALDLSKDQTYFLQAVPRSRFESCLFPLADIPKVDVRRIAQEQGFHVHDKKDSTGICFIGERRFSDFLNRYIPNDPGPIVSSSGEVIGEHLGLPYYTIGQRQGLGIGGLQDAHESAWYVKQKHLATNELEVTQDQSQLNATTLTATDLNLLVDDPMALSECSGMVRYRSTPASCRVEVAEHSIKVKFDKSQRAITPGQFIAFYSDSQCLGGAKIDQVIS